jgi:hypothetical protein
MHQIDAVKRLGHRRIDTADRNGASPGARETQRQAMSRAAVLRQAAPKVASFVMASADDPRFPRIFALVNKTNQFNTSDKR